MSLFNSVAKDKEEKVYRDGDKIFYKRGWGERLVLEVNLSEIEKEASRLFKTGGLTTSWDGHNGRWEFILDDYYVVGTWSPATQVKGLYISDVGRYVNNSKKRPHSSFDSITFRIA